MWGDCHIHMILDGVDYRAAFARHRDRPDDALIHARLADYRERGVAFLRDGGDRWGVGLRAKALAGGLRHRLPVSGLQHLPGRALRRPSWAARFQTFRNTAPWWPR